MNAYTAQSSCRICQGSLESVLDLGMLYPSAFLSKDDALPDKAPLELVKCQECGLVQLGHTVDLDSMYRTYYYQSGINPTMVKALKDVAQCVMERVMLEEDDVVVDIGANDGTSLSLYPKKVIKVGFEPSLNIAPQAIEHCDYLINDYFSASSYPLGKKARVVTSLAMFYDLPEPKQFVADVASILAPDGIWVMQISDLCSMLKTNSIENICHEHLEYYCTRDILNLVHGFGLSIFRIEHNDVNSGSLRFYICWQNVREIEDSVYETLQAEFDYFNAPEGSIKAFAQRVDQARITLADWLKGVSARESAIYGLAASTKANTLLQYFGIDDTLIKAIGDLNEVKFGRVMVGSNIPIISEPEVLDANPDAIIVFAWHFLKFFLEKLKPYMLAGGLVVSPLPTPELFWMEDEDPEIVQHVALMLATGIDEDGH